MLEEPVSSSAPTFWAVINSWFTPTVFFVVLQLVIATIYITSNMANTNRKQHQHQHKQEQDSQGADTEQHPQQLPRSPSTLERPKSINFHSYTYRSHEAPLQIQNAPQSQTHEGEEEQQQHHPQIARSPTMLQRLKSINQHNYFPTTDTTHESEKHRLDHDDMLQNHEPEKHHLEDAAVVETGEEKEDTAVPSLDEVYSQLLQGQGRHFNRSESDTAPASGEMPVKLPRKMKKSASTKSAFSHFREDEIIAMETLRPVSAAVDGGGDDDGVDAKADDFINKFKEQLKLQRLDSVTRYKGIANRGQEGVGSNE